MVSRLIVVVTKSALLGLAGSVALILALGPELGGIAMPFQLFANFVPGFDNIRVVSRLAVPFLLAVAVFGAWGLRQMMGSVSQARRGLVVALVAVVILIEMWVEPMRVEVDETAQIRALLAAASPGAVLELPIREVPDSDFSFIEGPRLLASIGDWAAAVQRVLRWFSAQRPGEHPRALPIPRPTGLGTDSRA